MPNQSFEAFILLQCIPDYYFTKKRTLRNFEDYCNLIALNYLCYGKQASNTYFHLVSEDLIPRNLAVKPRIMFPFSHSLEVLRQTKLQLKICAGSNHSTTKTHTQKSAFLLSGKKKRNIQPHSQGLCDIQNGGRGRKSWETLQNTPGIAILIFATLCHMWYTTCVSREKIVCPRVFAAFRHKYWEDPGDEVAKFHLLLQVSSSLLLKALKKVQFLGDC